MLLEPVRSAESLRFVPLHDLEIDELNPRRDHDPDAIASLAASIKAVGLIQNLSGRLLPNGKIGVVAGGRRLAALRLLAETGEAPELVAVKIAADATEAEFWAHIENDQREALSAADEIVAFRRLAQQGKTFAEIAQVFGCKERRVAQRMKLASLDDEILAALRAGEITLDIAEAMTVASSRECALEVLSTVRGRNYSVYGVRQMLLRDRVAGNDPRALFVGAEAYRAAGGEISEDLFATQVFFEDAALLQKLCDEKLAVAVEEAISTEGWLWAESRPQSVPTWELRGQGLSCIAGAPAITDQEAEELDELEARLGDDDCDPDEGQDGDYDPNGDLDGDDDHAPDYGRVPPTAAESERIVALRRRQYEQVYGPETRAVSGVLLWVGRDGSIGRLEGVVRKADAAAAAKVTGEHGPTQDSGQKKSGDTFSAALSQDLAAIRLASVQAALAENAELALDILGFELSHRFCQMLDVCLRETSNKPENKAGFEFPAVLDAPQDGLDFASFRKLPQAERTRRLVRGVAVLLTKGWRNHDEFEVIAAECGADARRVWTPTTEGYWKRITAGQMDAVIRSLLGWADDSDDWKAFSRMKKGEKAAIMGELFVPGSAQRLAYRVTPEQEAAIDAWTPAPLQPVAVSDA